TDQRGALRGALGLNAGPNPDIGAYEASSSYLVTLTTDTTDVGTLRAAVGWANVSTNVNPANSPVAPNTVTFDPSVTGTITLGSGLTISSNVTITGPGATVLTVSGGGPSSSFSVFTMYYWVTACISGLTISNGNADSGGGVYNDGSLTLANDTLSGNSAEDGGGIYNDNYGTVTLTNDTLSGNSATDGGGIYNYG